MLQTSYKQHCFLLVCSNADCGMNPMKPNYENFKSIRNYIKYGGINKHVRLKPNRTRYQCEVCYKTFKNQMMMDFHKRYHPRQLSSSENNLNNGDNLKTGNKYKYKFECGNKIQLQIHLQTGEQNLYICLNCTTLLLFIFKILLLFFKGNTNSMINKMSVSINMYF